MNTDNAPLSLPLIDVLTTPPPVLYHYTSIQGLLSIVESGRIRASHIRYLNDSSEIKWMWNVVLRQLESRRDSTASEEERKRLKELIQLAESRPRLNEFVASFSEEGDDLSQWRAYCPGGSGFSIGFASSAVRSQWVSDPVGGKPTWVGAQLLKVKYLNEQNTIELDAQVDLLLKLASQAVGMEGFNGPISENQFFLAFLSVAAPSFKHDSFRAEKEWRLILSKPHKPMPGQRFRSGKSTVVPYIEVELNHDIDFNLVENYMISRIVVGPTPDPELSIEALQNLFISKGHDGVIIEKSTIPYRHW